MFQLVLVALQKQQASFHMNHLDLHLAEEAFQMFRVILHMVYCVQSASLSSEEMRKNLTLNM